MPQTYIHTTSANAVMLVWDLLRLTPITQSLIELWKTSKRTTSHYYTIKLWNSSKRYDITTLHNPLSNCESVQSIRHNNITQSLIKLCSKRTTSQHYWWTCEWVPWAYDGPWSSHGSGQILFATFQLRSGNLFQATQATPTLTVTCKLPKCDRNVANKIHQLPVYRVYREWVHSVPHAHAQNCKWVLKWNNTTQPRSQALTLRNKVTDHIL